MTKLILVRHGQTVWNVEMKYQGHSDIALTEKGVQQAELVANRLANEKINAVYASDLSRAFQTAEKIARKFTLPVTSLPDLREISFGKWEGLTYDGIYKEWPDVMNKLFTHPDEVQIPGGETFRQVKERASQAIEKLVAKHPDETIAVVSHGGTIRTILCAILDIHLNHVWNIVQDNTAVNIINYYSERTMVSLVNDTHHLLPK
ncbi:MAG TPA: alpha-ribazole phosphatase [Negativicutes bacterium]|jgi:alpha-ribazole phosphatase